MQCLNLLRLKALVKAAPLGAALMWCAVIQTLPARAAEFSVSPIGVQFEPGRRSATVAINNADKRPIRFQLTLVEWTQNAKGEDIYTPSDDLIFFPHQLTVQPGERGIARIGPKRPPAGTEKAYRLRVEELADPAPEGGGLSLNFTITFAVPVYLGSLDARPALVIAPLQMQDGKLLATLQNTGNAHFRIESMEVKGADGYAQQLNGWYLLPGAGRQYTLAIPPEVCRAQQRLNLSVKVGENHFDSGLSVDPSMCGS